MKLFKLIDLRYSKFTEAIRSYLSQTLAGYGETYGNNTIFGQLINVMSSAVQNVFSYIEDALTEQNKYTATRKQSIYNLASQTGYNPSLGTTSTCVITLAYKTNNIPDTTTVIPNKTKMKCSQNGMTYNIILPQEAIVMNVAQDNATKYITLVEGTFETQTYVANGGKLYNINLTFNGDTDVDYLEVYVNDEKWERRESLYDMDADGKQFYATTSLKKGLDITFGNDVFGRALSQYDRVVVTYLLHHGESGNINPNTACGFTFQSSLTNLSGEEIDGNAIFDIKLYNKENISSGTDAESLSQVKEMIGFNSRALVLADAQNYKQFLSRYSFVGYNRTWSEKGSLIVNSLIIRNFKSNLDQVGQEYFKLTESDFKLTSTQKASITSALNDSGQQLAGSVFNIFDPEICKYALYIFIKLKTTAYNKEYVGNNVRSLVGEFFADIQNDIFVPKSDIIHLLKSEISEIDGVTCYFISERNESAKMNNEYIKKTYSYNPATGTYDIKKEHVYVFDGENPNVGLDSHGNIYLDNNEQFPVLMGGWTYESEDYNGQKQEITINDPLTIIFE